VGSVSALDVDDVALSKGPICVKMEGALQEAMEKEAAL
jgi:hypothetical protein